MLYGQSIEAPPEASVYVISRVSSEEQAGEDKLSLKQQTEWLAGICRKRSWKIVETVEIGASASKPDSEYFATVDRLVRYASIDVVLFAAIDRFCRNILEGIARLYSWPKAGVHIYFGEHRFDPDNPDDVLMTIIMLGLSNHKADKNRKAAQIKSEYAKLQGRVYIRRLPPGYVKTERGRLEHDVRSAVVSRIWALIEEVGLAIAARTNWVKEFITQWYEDVGGKGRASEQTEKIDVEGYLREWLHHPLYRGEIPYGEDLYPWPAYAIGDQEQLARLRARYPAPRGSTSRPRREGTQARLEETATAIGIVQFLVRAFEERRVHCPLCEEPVKLNGYKTRGRLLVPQFACSCTTARLLFSQQDVDRYSPSLICPQCGEAHPTHLTVEATQGGFLIRCKSCGWRTHVKRSPWAPLPPPRAPQPASTPAHQSQLSPYDESTGESSS